ncbi:16663_t:CDS:2 [Funneliformis caledonium]|uniref:16663_t:CDS:1 n=1 Tax=Funneliformis caledonium TaxID=1117310 RepID=A0A9N9FTK0_9GLOM|nr:16663_t:CDS:2 [Funneliformis caledonium]
MKVPKEFSSYINESRNSVEIGTETTSYKKLNDFKSSNLLGNDFWVREIFKAPMGKDIERNNEVGMDINSSNEVYMPKRVPMTDESFNSWSNLVEMGKKTTLYKG